MEAGNCEPRLLAPSVSGLQKLNGLDVGGLSQQMEEERSQEVPPHWNTYFSVTNVDDTIGKVQQAGGALVLRSSN